MTESLTITTTPRADCQIDLTIELGPERTAQALHRAARAVAQKARIPGFRAGKAPDATVIRMFGREGVLNEIMDDLGEEVFREALETEKITPYGQASLEEIKTDPVSFKLVVPLPPNVQLGDYQSIRVAAPIISVGAEDVDTLIEQARTEHAAPAAVERAAEIGDTVVTDITGMVGEDSIMDNHDWELVLKDDSGWLPGFDAAFVGLAAGDEKSFTLTYPEDSASRYKGQEATFQAKVTAVKAQVKPELTDEFAKSLGDFESVADLQAKLLERLTAQRTAAAEETLTNQILQALVDGATIVYPPAAVESEIDNIMHDMEHRVSDAGYKLEDYLRLQGLTPQTYRERLRPQAEQRLKGRLALRELATAEKIEVAPEDIATELDRLIGLAGEGEEATQTREAFGSEAGQFVIRQDLLTERTLVRLREIAAGGPVLEALETASLPQAEAVISDAAETVAPETPAAPDADSASAEPAAEATSNE